MKRQTKKSISVTLRPEHIKLLEWYAENTEKSKSAVLDAALKEMLAAKESTAFFHVRLLERLGGPA